MSTAYPLSWPNGRPRKTLRKRAAFSTSKSGSKTSLSVADALARLRNELDLIGAKLPVISTNVELRNDGLPRSGQREPLDPAVAVYFQLSSRPHCMPCDTYDRVADNLAAVAAHISATRMIERHGVASVAEMFTGFAALPPPGAAAPWHETLGIRPAASRAEIEAAFREKAKQAHPDAGGSHAAMSALNAARMAALSAQSDGRG